MQTTSSPTSAADFRRHFPIFEKKTYLSSCSQGALSTEVRDAFAAYLSSWDEEGNPWDEWVDEMERLRGRFAKLINASPHEVAISFSASTAVNSLLSGMSFGERPGLVCTDLDFPTVGQICLANAERGAEVAFARSQDGRMVAEDVVNLIDDHTGLVAVSHVSYRTGAKLNVRAIVDAAHRSGVPVLLDAYQSVGSGRLDVKDLGVDFLVAGALKYLLGPPGVAFLYVDEAHIEGLRPTDTGWFAQENPFAFDVRNLDYAHSANRFQTGSPPVPSIYGAMAGLGLIEGIGLDQIERHIARLTAGLLGRAVDLGFAVTTPVSPDARGALVVIESTDAEALLQRLGGEGFLCSARGSGLRVSMHYYNTEDDVDRLVETLRRHQELVQRPPVHAL